MRISLSPPSGSPAPSPEEPSALSTRRYDLAAIHAGPEAAVPEQQLDLEILAGFVRAAGFRVLLLDSAGHRLGAAALLERATAANPLAVYWHLPSRAEVAVLRRLAARTGLQRGKALALAGGYFATRHDCAILEAVQELDAVLFGEAEVTLVELLRALRERRPWAAEPGLAHRMGGSPRRNAPRKLLEDLSVLPPATPDLFHVGRLARGQQVLFNRGCDSDCQYCGFQIPYRTSFAGRTRFWRSRQPEAIVDEIEAYATRHQVRRFIFNAYVLFGYDEAGSGILEEVLQGLLRRNLQIGFSFVTHPDKLLRNRHLLPLMKEAGLSSVYLGIDSGLPRALALYQVDFALSDVLAALETLHEEKVAFDVGFFFFDPYITMPEIRQHLLFLRRIQPCFSHLERPFSFFLEHQLLTAALRINWGMPLCRKLQEDGLLVPADPLVRDPAVRLADPAAGKFWAAHQSLWRSREIGRLRPLLWNPVQARLNDLELLPLRMAETLCSLLEREPAIDLDLGTALMASWVRNEVPDGAYIPESSTCETHEQRMGA